MASALKVALPNEAARLKVAWTNPALPEKVAPWNRAVPLKVAPPNQASLLKVAPSKWTMPNENRLTDDEHETYFGRDRTPHEPMKFDE